MPDGPGHFAESPPAALSETPSETQGLETTFVQALAVAFFEVIEGRRALSTLTRTLSFQAMRELGLLTKLRRDQLMVTRTRPRVVHGSGAVRIDRPQTDIAEVAAVVEVGARARAVAMRLEWQHGRWRVCELAVL